MSNVARVAGQAANTLTKPLNVEDVFSTYLYEGNGSTQTITNGIDLDGEGGLVWVKWRSGAVGSGAHVLVDTERGVNYWLSSSTTSAQNTTQNSVTAFNSNGFSIVDAGGKTNYSGDDYASWTFRKAPKFFDVVTYTGDGASTRTISHNLDADIGSVFIKGTNETEGWIVAHRSTSAGNKVLPLNSTGAEVTVNHTYLSGSTLTVGTAGNPSYSSNDSGITYVAYLFAHNDGDGDFGPTGDQDIIKCGSYTATAGTEVDLGFEPQWVIVKSTTSAADWYMFDNMRGWGADQGSNDNWLFANTSGAETNNTNSLGLTPTGFTSFNGGDQTYIYIAIRRGPMAVPTDATDVFKVDAEDSGSFNNPPLYVSGFPVDFALRKQTNNSANWAVVSRLTGTNYLQTNSTTAQSSVASYEFDYMNGWSSDAGWNAAIYSWMWRRAPNYFDVVAYTGNGTTGTKTHNLGVAPEMIWFKVRSDVDNWQVYHKDVGADKALFLDNSNASQTWGFMNNTAPTSSEFTADSGYINTASQNYIAYLFASLDGVSKVGSFTTAGSDVDVDCGFSAGPRFVLIKNTASGNWFVMDTERGITSGTDPFLTLNTTNAESSALDLIDINPTSTGFTVNQGSFGNGTFIFYAIA